MGLGNTYVVDGIFVLDGELLLFVGKAHRVGMTLGVDKLDDEPQELVSSSEFVSESESESEFDELDSSESELEDEEELVDDDSDDDSEWSLFPMFWDFSVSSSPQGVWTH